MPRSEPGPQGCCQGRGCRETSGHAHELPSLTALCAGIWALPELFRATQPTGVVRGGLPGPAPLSPSYPPRCAGTQLPIRQESTPAPAGKVFQAGNISNSYFFTQVRTKISLSHPSPATVTDITPATLVFPGPSPVTVLKSWCLQLLLL